MRLSNLDDRDHQQLCNVAQKLPPISPQNVHFRASPQVLGTVPEVSNAKTTYGDRDLAYKNGRKRLLAGHLGIAFRHHESVSLVRILDAQQKTVIFFGGGGGELKDSFVKYMIKFAELP